jgi:hypothetical protein
VERVAPVRPLARGSRKAVGGWPDRASLRRSSLRARLPCGARARRAAEPPSHGQLGCLCSWLRQAALDASPCGDAQPPSPCAPRRRRGARPATRPRFAKNRRCTHPRVHCGSRRGAGGWQASRLCGAEQRRPGSARAQHALRHLTHRGCLSAANEVERSEFRDATAGRAAQGSRRNAATAAVKRSLPPARASARAATKRACCSPALCARDCPRRIATLRSESHPLLRIPPTRDETTDMTEVLNAPVVADSPERRFEPGPRAPTSRSAA